MESKLTTYSQLVKKSKDAVRLSGYEKSQTDLSSFVTVVRPVRVTMR